MSLKNQLLSFFTFLFITSIFCPLKSDAKVIVPFIRDNNSLAPYLLPRDHPLQESLRDLFFHPQMFHSPQNFRKADFTVKLGHKGLMIGSHFAIPGYLIKKFHNKRPQAWQLKNYIERIKGANLLRQLINEHRFKHLVVPMKWLYPLPSSFGNGSYILVVEDMDICSTEENELLYYNMDIEVLTELCTLLSLAGGCDAFPRNQPFTKSGKIAFVDTEHTGELKGHFIKHIIPALNEELQPYALALWKKLEKEKK